MNIDKHITINIGKNIHTITIINEIKNAKIKITNEMNIQYKYKDRHERKYRYVCKL